MSNEDGGEWSIRKQTHKTPTKAGMYPFPNSDLSCYTGPYRCSSDSTRLGCPPTLLAASPSAQINVQSLLCSTLQSRCRCGFPAHLHSGDDQQSRRGHKACGARHRRSRNPEMGILGEVALYHWDGQLATEGPWYERNLRVHLSSLSNSSCVGVETYCRAGEVGECENGHSLTGIHQEPRSASRHSSRGVGVKIVDSRTVVPPPVDGSMRASPLPAQLGLTELPREGWLC